MKFTRPVVLLSFDIEEFDLPTEFGVPVPEEDLFTIPRTGTQRISELVNAANVKATFFVTGAFAEKYPELIRDMVSHGHEVASHGFSHSTFDVSDLTRSKETLEKISGASVSGFRMARLAPVKKEEILNAGYLYESSVNPVFLPGRYHNLDVPLTPYREECGLLQFPVSAVPLIRFPLFWLSFKNLPFGIYQTLSNMTLSMTKQYNMYSHPWEYNERAKEAQWHIPGYIVRHAGQEQMKRLERLIANLKGKGAFLTFREAVDELS